MTPTAADRARRHDALVARLVADVRPVAHLWSPAARLSAWSALALGLGVAVAGPNRLPDLGTRITEPLFCAQLASLAFAALWCGWLTFRAAVPGREPGPRALALTLAVVTLPAILTLAHGPGAEGDLAAFVGGGAKCTMYTLVVGAIPWLTALIALRRGAPLAPRVAAALAGAAALLAATAALRTACPLGDGSWHLLAWHLAPVAAGAIVSASLAVRWLRGPSALGRDDLRDA